MSPHADPVTGDGVLTPVLAPLGGGTARGPRVEARRRASARALAEAARLAGAPAAAAFERLPDLPPRAPAGWYASLANTARLAAAVVAREPVGIDLEPLGRRRLEAARTLLRESGELERFGLPAGASGEEQSRAVLWLWTAKEAVVKRAGVGIAGFPDARPLAIEPRRARFAFRGERLWVHWLEVQDHVLALASALATPPLRPRELPS